MKKPLLTTLTFSWIITLAPTVWAQKPVTMGEAVTETFTIEAIDQTSRLVTLKDRDGFTETVYAGSEVKRFDALKVGDKVTFRYYESVVMAVRKPGQAPAAPAGTAGVIRSEGPKPGGTVSQQVATTVTIEAIDMKVPSVTIRTEDGRRMSMKVENKKNLEGLKVGDKVEITYTQALAISVQPPSE